MTTPLWLVALLAADTASGTVRVVGSSVSVEVTLATDSGVVRLEGEQAAEIKALGSFRVEVQGEKKADAFLVSSYSIVDIGGGKKPWMGILLSEGGKLSLRSEVGKELIPLKLSKRLEKRLGDVVGSRVWVYGKQKSGYLKVQRFGLLRLPPDAKDDVKQRAAGLQQDLDKELKGGEEGAAAAE